SRHCLSPSPESRQEVVQLRQLDLELAFTRSGVQREDVQDEGGAVQDLHPEPLLQAPQLPGGQLVVQDHRVGPRGMDEIVDLLDLSLPDESRRVWLRTSLEDLADGLRSGRPRQR